MSSNATSPDYITVVSGLPRSGTSMMIRMLDSGGIPALTDGEREADESNPRGYFELERVKKLKDGDTLWVGEARGKAVKVISALLQHLPAEQTYRIIFMRRNMDEILASQKQMLVKRGEPTDRVSDADLARMYAAHLERVTGWLAQQAHMRVVYIHYNEMLQNPLPAIQQVNQLVDGRLNEATMAAVIDPGLYRQRKG